MKKSIKRYRCIKRYEKLHSYEIRKAYYTKSTKKLPQGTNSRSSGGDPRQCSPLKSKIRVQVTSQFYCHFWKFFLLFWPCQSVILPPPNKPTKSHYFFSHWDDPPTRPPTPKNSRYFKPYTRPAPRTNRIDAFKNPSIFDYIIPIILLENGHQQQCVLSGYLVT